MAFRWEFKSTMAVVPDTSPARNAQHRMKNLIASIRALANQTYDESENLDGFYESFEGRLQALARFQTLFDPDGTARVNLKELLAEEFLAHAALVDREIALQGPNLEIEPKAGQAFALAFHELTTSSVTQGALSHDDGRVSVLWQIAVHEGADCLQLEWHDNGGGLGRKFVLTDMARRLIEHALPYEVGGSSRLEFSNGECRCLMSVPFTHRIRRAKSVAANDDRGDDFLE